MLGITDIDLKETRFYQDVFAEGWREGWQEGWQEARLEMRLKNLLEGQHECQRLCEVCLLRRQLTRRFGPLPDWAEQRLQNAPLAELESWAERVLDAPTLDAVWTETGH